MSEAIEKKEIEENYHQSKLMSFIMNDPTATVQTLIDGDKQGETVREGEYSIEYEIFTKKGVEARINIDIFETMGDKIAKMQSEVDEEDGKPVYTKDDIKTYIKKWCFNRVKANGSSQPTRDDFMALVQYVEDIVFNENKELRQKPPKGIDKSKAVSKYKTWTSKKFKVKISVDAFINLENKVRKLRKKGLKKDTANLDAETEKVEFLQAHMAIVPGNYCSGSEFVAYFKELFKYMFPPTFGVPDKTPEQLEKGKEIPKNQKKLTEIEAEDGQDEDEPSPAKKKKGRKPKKE
jgi:hypothetical protein